MNDVTHLFKDPQYGMILQMILNKSTIFDFVSYRKTIYLTILTYSKNVIFPLVCCNCVVARLFCSYACLCADVLWICLNRLCRYMYAYIILQILYRILCSSTCVSRGRMTRRPCGHSPPPDVWFFQMLNKNVCLVPQCIAKTKGCCCNVSVGVALKVWFSHAQYMKMTRDEHVLGFKSCNISIYWWIWMSSFLLKQNWIGIDDYLLSFGKLCTELL